MQGDARREEARATEGEALAQKTIKKKKEKKSCSVGEVGLERLKNVCLLESVHRAVCAAGIVGGACPDWSSPRTACGAFGSLILTS